jgi:hypothetical protein
LRSYSAAGDAGAGQRAGSTGTRNAFSPRVPVAIKNKAASRIATVKVAVTRTTGAFIDTQSRCTSPRVAVRELLKTLKNNSGLNRDWHRHADLERKHREGDDQAKRQRTDRQRGRNGVVQSGRGYGRGAAFKACCARRPSHGRVPLMRGRITCDRQMTSQPSQAILRRRSIRKWQNGGESSGYARYLS